MNNPIQHEKLPPGGGAGKVDNPMFHGQQEGGGAYQTATVKSELDHGPPTRSPRAACGNSYCVRRPAVTFITFTCNKKLHDNSGG